MGQLDNTILMVMADNGASQEGGPFGVMHEMMFFNGILESRPTMRSSESTTSAVRTVTPTTPGVGPSAETRPFRWYKQNTHEGGVHVPMVMHWPDGIGP